VIDRVTVPEAAKRLGVSEGALRQRVHRGTIEHERDEEGRVYVYITPDDTHENTVQDSQYNAVNYALLDELRDRIRFLESELEDRKEESRRKDSIIMSLTQRVPELEPASEPRESSVPASEEQDKGDVPQDQPEAKPEANQASWWWRLFRG